MGVFGALAAMALFRKKPEETDETGEPLAPPEDVELAVMPRRPIVRPQEQNVDTIAETVQLTAGQEQARPV